ncbi:L-histidine N(alpha)-methyltransferase [Maribacter hydrothermalis]|uniref:Dimethylhistidine N-methyltransferase n=1 Tax=Maribacter hydrothermalis TaxID=1836467 RepID=A0A1B7ZDR2_9FLAO|nr:L-histidine N(alpha)-methyltransferase [Maribacter hydrothermalis]APQ16652.1 dimethylhistidine N-methyltransferase [Maribacter hydrothermalis]OBR41443.1 dimethylhistidine N-methyltransferase [Maribacter hydrothermalis]
MQDTKIASVFTSEFEKEVYFGLTDSPKHLSSKYFYDKIGDQLFQKIMAMPTYYLTDCEYEILENNKEEIRELFIGSGPFDLIELGAGDGKKTKILLKEFSDKNIDFTYVPIDISDNALKQLHSSIKKELPDVNVHPFQGTYFEALKEINNRKNRKIILFLGSNIGNLVHKQAVDFMNKIQKLMQPDDLLFMGFDQKKNPKTILDAYNDQEGVTAAFNKNVLARINTELNANFDLNQFLHWEVYNPETGTAKSYLVSKIQQTVKIENLKLRVDFKQWETIHTEISQKYDDEIINWLAKEAGLEMTTEYESKRLQYKNCVFKKY